MKKLLIGVVIIVILGVVGFIALTVLLAKAPFAIPEERLAFSYIDGLDKVGKYEKRYTSAEDEYVIYDTADSTESDSGILARTGNDASLFNNFLDQYKDKDCSVRTSGTIGDVNYAKGACGSNAYYVYVTQKDGKTQGILFDTNREGQAGLDEFLQSFIK